MSPRPASSKARIPIQAFLKESLPEAVLLIVYLVLGLLFRGNWEFTRDDGATLISCMDAVNGGSLPLQGPLSSLGIQYLPFSTWVTVFFYWLHPSLGSIQLGLIGLQLMTHFFIIRCGAMLQHREAGIAASVLFFFTPAFFTFYQQKFWNIAIFPLYLIVGLWCLLGYARSKDWRWLAGSGTAVAMASSAHMTGLLFFPVIILAPLLCGAAKVPRQAFIALSLIGGVALTPWMYAMIYQGWLSRTPGILGSWSRPNMALSHLNDVLSPFSRYVPYRIGSPEPSWPRWLDWLPMLPIVACFLAHGLRRWRAQNPLRNVFLAWCALPVALAILAGFRLKNFPHHWILVAFPAFPLAVSLMITRSVSTPPWVRRLAVIVLAAPGAWLSIKYSRYVERTGGLNWHLPRIADRQTVFERLFADGRIPKIYLLKDTGVPDWWWYDLEGWRALTRLYTQRALSAGSAAGKDRHFLYSVDGAASHPDMRRQAERIPGLRRMRVGSIEVFSSDRPRSALGLYLQ